MQLAFLGRLLDDEQVVMSDDARTEHGHDWGTPADDGTPPDAVVYPESTADVAAVLEAAAERTIPVTPYAAGTGIQGSAVPSAGGISMDLTRMDAIGPIRPDALQVDVQPGVLGSDLNDALAAEDLFFPSLPASGDMATVGGMIATDASGMRTVKYGEVGDRVLRLEAVLPDGTVIETGSRAAKSSSGYNLTDLLVGSEGTLAVVTEATLAVAPQPAWIYGGRVLFEDRVAAAAAVADTIQAGIDVAKIELVDAVSAAMVNAYLEAELPDAPMVFVEFHGPAERADAVETFRSIAETHDAQQIDLAAAGEDLDALWAARAQLSEALRPYDPELTPIALGDVAVPIDEFAPLIGDISRWAEEKELLIPCFGHAGDGNVHYAIMARADDPEHVATCKRINDRIIERAIERGGTATGEHGIGTHKREHLRDEFNDATLAVMRQLKQSIDPAGILNPNTAIPNPSA